MITVAFVAIVELKKTNTSVAVVSDEGERNPRTSKPAWIQNSQMVGGSATHSDQLARNPQPGTRSATRNT